MAKKADIWFSFSLDMPQKLGSGAAFDNKSIRYLTSVALVNVVGAFQQITGASYNRCFRLESKSKSYIVYLTCRHNLESKQGSIFRLDLTNQASYTELHIDLFCTKLSHPYETVPSIPSHHSSLNFLNCKLVHKL